MYDESIFEDLGFRRKAFRRITGESDCEFFARRIMEKEERKRLLAGRVIWMAQMGPYRREKV